MEKNLKIINNQKFVTSLNMEFYAFACYRHEDMYALCAKETRFPIELGCNLKCCMLNETCKLEYIGEYTVHELVKEEEVKEEEVKEEEVKEEEMIHVTGFDEELILIDRQVNRFCNRHDFNPSWLTIVEKLTIRDNGLSQVKSLELIESNE
jgi:hypothetical protein